DRQADFANGFEEGLGGFRRRDDAADVDAGAIEHPARRAEVVLHVDDQRSRPCGIDLERLRPRVERDHESMIRRNDWRYVTRKKAATPRFPPPQRAVTP